VNAESTKKLIRGQNCNSCIHRTQYVLRNFDLDDGDWCTKRESKPAEFICEEHKHFPTEADIENVKAHMSQIGSLLDILKYRKDE